jgi:hypothetical protein
MLQPWPDGLVTGQACRVGQALTQRFPDRWGHEGHRAWRLSHGQHLGAASCRIGREPATDGMATAPEPLRHLTAGAGLPGWQDIEGLETCLLVHVSRSLEEPLQFLGSFVDRRNRRVHGDRLQPRMGSA